MDSLSISSSSSSYEELLTEESRKTPKEEKAKKQVNFYNSNILSRIFFSWSRLAMKISNNGILKTSDVSELHPTQSTRYNITPLQNSWKNFSKHKDWRYPLAHAIFVVHIKPILSLQLLDFCNIALEFLNMYFFRLIIQHFSTGNFGKTFAYNNQLSLWENIKNFDFDIYQCAFFFIFVKLLMTIFTHQVEFKNTMLSERITNEMNALLYEKILMGNTNSPNASKAEGEKMNLIEVDSEKIGYLFFVGPKIVSLPLRVLISMFLLFNLFGKKFVYALIVLALLIGLILLLQVAYLRNLKILLEKKDDRMKIVTYIFQIIKSIKINGWEDTFANKIKKSRNDELDYLRRNFNIDVTRTLINSNMPLVMFIVSLGLYVFSHKALEISDLFTFLQLINLMTTPLMQIPLMISEFFSNLISINRLQKFLFTPEHDYSSFEDRNLLLNENILVKFDKATFGVTNSTDLPKYHRRLSKNELVSTFGNKVSLISDISFTIKEGEFIAILGQTGSGKSCLINSIMNNYTLLSNKKSVVVNGTISYDPQQSWVMNDTIRNNILFFNEYDENKYNKIISCCQLIQDFETFPKKDLNEISSSGGNLSGGQRARVSLARCLYKDADLYLLDDPLASIDAKVGTNIFKEAFNGYLKGKARILITNEFSNLSLVDKIIYLDKGSIIFEGNFNEFLKKFGNDYEIQLKEKKEKEEKEKELQRTSERKKSRRLSKVEKKNIINELKKMTDKDEKEKKEIETSVENPLSMKGKKGKISLKTYLIYIKVQGGFIVFFLLIIFILGARVCDAYKQIFVTSWSKSAQEISNIHKKGINLKKHYYHFYKYIYFSLIGIFLNFAIEFVITRTTLHSLKKLHETMVYKLLKAPINLFHDLVPIGQILNRLTKDIDLVQGIIGVVTLCMKSIICLFVSIYVCYIYNNIILILSPVLFIISLLLTNYYIGAGRNLTRLHRVSYSPIITILSESIKGVELIRSANVEENCKAKIYKRLDDHFAVHYFIEGTKKWYGQRLRIASHFFLGVIISFIIYKKESFSPQAIGLILEYAHDFSDELANVLHYMSQIEVAMVSLERCETVTEIKGEKTPDKNEEIKIVKGNWPSKGQIKFVNFSAKYRPFTPVILKKLNIIINPGEKVGIVGRTGSGKSSIVLSLSRIIEGFEGKIEIDGVDITKLNLDDLRQNITIVPQDSFLIEGTLRENLDPMNIYKDEEIIKCLDEFSLFKKILDNNKRLNVKIKENGSNLSIGEKQLICFVRAALKKSKVIILDEATSSMDVQTEKIIQNNMNENMKDSTIIMIAHHIQMVSKCERIIVIDKGQIVECDNYDKLMNDKKSKFYELYSESLIS